ncbi:hypothetical protein PENSPDRAFT_667581 [Peniophora sp. CONT]|nr:hypothetical protein PENSPDRAFT_667581 [Peniophora sp. CONT]
MFSTPNFGKNEAAPLTTSHSQPVPEARIPTINTSRVQSAAARFTPAHKSSPAPRISTGETIDLSSTGSESSMRAHAAATTARKRQLGEVPLMPPTAGVKRLKISPTPSERGSPVGEAEKENRAMYSSAERGKERMAASSSLASSQTLFEVTDEREASLAGLDNENLHTKSVTELQHLVMFDMETVSQLKKDRKVFDIKLKADQDVYLLDAFIRLAESRAQAWMDYVEPELPSQELPSILQNLAMKLNIFVVILRFYCRRKDRKAFGTTIVTTGPPSSLSDEHSAPAPCGTTYETWYVPDEALRDLHSTFPLPEVPFVALHLSAVRRRLNNEIRHLAEPGTEKRSFKFKLGDDRGPFHPVSPGSDSTRMTCLISIRRWVAPGPVVVHHPSCPFHREHRTILSNEKPQKGSDKG